ncbi:hypothetical protein EVAR_11960_1 [Eumeta japonica]|uniref:Uncharacterized protein n=1 Tax=Eumeta variegata TaxID=151549 RepID=A0A4C1U4W4_EUMVA|nr:hypothetical protein EVAR_11960_1 [Eumeta japonica]
MDSKGIVILNGRNSIKGLKFNRVRHGLPKSILITCDAQSRLPYLLLKERELRRPPGVKEIPTEEVKEDLLTQDLPGQSVRRITNRAREPLDLVLVTANTGIDQETKRSFYASAVLLQV